MATIKTNQNNPDHKIFSYLSKLNPSSRYLLCSTHCKYPMGIRPIVISIWDIYCWCICSYLCQVSFAFNSLDTKWFVYWFLILILFCRSPCLPFHFGASILQAYVHLGYLLMSATLPMPFLRYFVCTDWMGCFLSSFSFGLLAPIYLMWHLHFWIGNLDG